jgi:hypothetical protein
MAASLKVIVTVFAPLSGITVAKASQLGSSILQHDDIKLAAVRISSPIPRDDDALDVWDGKKMFVCVRLAGRRSHVLVEKEFGEHPCRLI